jgi:hypothetical protein
MFVIVVLPARMGDGMLARFRGDGASRADIGDRVVMDFSWKLYRRQPREIESSARRRASPRKMERSRDDLFAAGAEGRVRTLRTLQLHVHTAYPVVEVAQTFTVNRKSVPLEHGTWTYTPTRVKKQPTRET